MGYDRGGEGQHWKSSIFAYLCDHEVVQSAPRDDTTGTYIYLINGRIGVQLQILQIRNILNGKRGGQNLNTNTNMNIYRDNTSNVMLVGVCSCTQWLKNLDKNVKVYSHLEFDISARLWLIAVTVPIFADRSS